MFDVKVQIGKGKLKLDREQGQALLEYLVQGLPAPPPDLVKHACIAYYQKLSGYRIFIETGTYLGATLSQASAIFDRCYSVELSEELYSRAKSRFKAKKHVELLHGSSADLLPPLLRETGEPAVIWLDAHFSGGSTAGEGSDPLQGELAALVEHRDMRHVILIDDARGLGVSDRELKTFISAMGAGYQASLLHDSVRVVPKELPLLGQPLAL